MCNFVWKFLSSTFIFIFIHFQVETIILPPPSWRKIRPNLLIKTVTVTISPLVGNNEAVLVLVLVLANQSVPVSMSTNNAASNSPSWSIFFGAWNYLWSRKLNWNKFWQFPRECDWWLVTGGSEAKLNIKALENNLCWLLWIISCQCYLWLDLS